MHTVDRGMVRAGQWQWNLRVCLLLLAPEGQFLNILLFKEHVFLHEKDPLAVRLLCVPLSLAAARGAGPSGVRVRD